MKNNSWETTKGTITDSQVDRFIKKMAGIIEAAAAKELGVDCDSDSPLRICIINKIKFENRLPLPVEHSHLVETDYEKSERLYSIFLNCSAAFTNLECELNQIRRKQLEIRDKENKNEE